MMPTALLKELGGFDESYFLYLEETDLCKRIAEAGKIVYHLPTVSIIHVGQQSSLQAAEWTNVEFYLSAYKFIRSHNPRRVAGCALQLVILLNAIVRIGLWCLRFCLKPKQRLTAIKMLKGYFNLSLIVWRFEAYYQNGASASGQRRDTKTILDSKQSLR